LVAYWLLFAYFAGSVLLSGRSGDRQSSVLLLAGAALIALAIGLRYKVGGDWGSYEFLFSYARYADLGKLLQIGDPGYQLLNWTVQRLGAGLWLVNLVCGTLFAWGLYRFCRVQPDSWLAFTAAIPYLVVVVGMGYSRQAVAIGFLMAGLAALARGASVLKFSIYVAVAVLFHKTAVVVLPLVIFAGQRNRLLNILAGVSITFLLYDLFLAESMEGFVRNYLRTQYSSQGAAIRVAMNLLPAVIFLWFRKRLRFHPAEERVWLFFALASLVMPLLLVVTPSTTVVDRLALYLIPLQMAVLPRVRYLFAGETGRVLVAGYSALALFTWLNFAVYAEAWVPYQLYPAQF
jgi:hypothetical protein